MKKPYLVKITVTILIATAGFLLGWFMHTPVVPVSAGSVRENSPDYKFINPLLLLKVPEDQATPEYVSLKKQVSDYVENSVREKKASDISVYFRSLNSEKWISVNPNEQFAPASMLKVVTLIAVLREAESDPNLLSKVYMVRGNDQSLTELEKDFPTTDPVKAGKTYTVQELINHMIVDSDNVANSTLENVVSNDKILKVYDDLQLPRPNNILSDQYTTREYSHLFRALYNGTYLSRSLSEQVLELLSHTNFTSGIVAGVPDKTTVSHKFGTYATTNEKNQVINGELHDCGIVYKPEDPYFICVMSRGNDSTTLQLVIKDISKIVWDSVGTINND